MGTVLFTGEEITRKLHNVWNTLFRQMRFNNQGTASANYSLFDSSQSIGSISGSNNVSGDLFIDADEKDNAFQGQRHDLRLQASSPAINQASDSVSDYPSTDINELSRNGAPDIGANEFYSASAPVFSSATSFSTAENQTGVGTVTATDANGDALTFSITGGLDQSLFTINATTGVLVFNSAPDYESAGDNGGDNVYNLTIQVSDGSLSVSENLTVTVTDVDESILNDPNNDITSSSSLRVRENLPVGTLVSSFEVADLIGDELLYYLSEGAGGENNSKFSLK